MDVWKKYLKKKVFVVLKNDRRYSGKLINISDIGNGLIFLSIIDIKNHLVTFTSDEIKMIQEEE